MLNAANVKPDAGNDAKQAGYEQWVVRGKGAEARRYQHQSTYYNKYYANERGQFLHKNVKFQAKLRNNYELCIKNYELFCTFAPAFCKNNIF